MTPPSVTDDDASSLACASTSDQAHLAAPVAPARTRPHPAAPSRTRRTRPHRAAPGRTQPQSSRRTRVRPECGTGARLAQKGDKPAGRLRLVPAGAPKSSHPFVCPPPYNSRWRSRDVSWATGILDRHRSADGSHASDARGAAAGQARCPVPRHDPRRLPRRVGRDLSRTRRRFTRSARSRRERHRTDDGLPDARRGPRPRPISAPRSRTI